MNAGVLDPPTRVLGDRAGLRWRRPAGGGPSLEEHLSEILRALQTDGVAECPVCHARMTGSCGPATCGQCGSRLC
jgi:hypothetical protein